MKKLTPNSERTLPVKKNLHPFYFQTVLFSILVGLFSASLAYADAGAPSVTDEEKRLKEGSFLKDKAVSEAAAPKPAVIQKETPPPPPPPPSSSKLSVTFKLKSVKFSGNESVDSKDLEEVVKPILNRDIVFLNVMDAISDLKRLYRDRGFVATYIYAPEQDVKSGVLEIKILEGKLGKIDFTGNKFHSTALLSRYIKIKPNDIIRYNNFKAGLTRLNKNEDINATAVLKPGSATGTTDIEVKSDDRSPIHLGIDANNLGTKDTGIYRYGLSVADSNLFGNLDELNGRFSIGSGAWATGESYNIPINDIGTRVGLGISYAKIDVAGDFNALGLEGISETYSPYFSHPLIEREDVDVTLNAGLDVKRVKNYALGALASQDDLRILNTGLNFDERDETGRSFAPQTFSWGLGRFLGGADKIDEHAIRADTGGAFFVYRGSYVRYQRLPWYELMFTFRSAWQLTQDRLPSSEQFRIGGSSTVRGYKESEYSSDNGGFGSGELMAPIYFIPKSVKLPFSKEELRSQIQMVGFIDFGDGTLKRPEAGERTRHSLTGMGFGLRAHLYDKYYGRIQWGFPIGSTASDTRGSTFYFGVSAELL